MCNGQNREDFSTHTHTQVSVAEQGRSLTEMMGTLAIMGILAIAGIWMYNSAMDRLKANTIINEAQKRAVVVAGQIGFQDRTDPSLGEFSDNEIAGGTFSTNVITNGLYKQFGIQVSGVPKAVCQNILNAIGDTTPLRRLSATTSPTTSLTSCGDNNAFLLVYNNDMSTAAGDTQYCQDDSACHTVCGSCNTTSHLCEGECEAPSGTCSSDFQCQQAGICAGCNSETGTCKTCERVAYLESDGGQWFDTDIIPTNNTGVNITYAYTVLENNSSRLAGVCGTYSGSNMGTLLVSTYTGYQRANDRIGIYHRGGKYDTDANLTLVKDKKYTVKVNYKNNGRIIIDGTYSTNAGTQNVSTEEIRLFGRYSNGSYSAPKVRIYSAEFTEGSNTIRNFVPVLDADGVPAMYDKVDGGLYYNEGSGTFKTDKTGI